jgi:N-acetylglutamate synthase-like GNAT family acetyltransferase
MKQRLADKVVKKNYDFLKGMYIKDTEDADFGFYSYSSVDYGDTDVFWNHAVIPQEVVDLEEEMMEVKEFYQDRGKNSAFYIPVVEPVRSVLEDLKEKGFNEVFTDVWMFHTGKELPEGRSGVELVKVPSEGEMDEFVDLFYKSHAPDLDDPYAGLSEQYGEQLKDKHNKDFEGFDVHHFIVDLNGEAVGHVTFVEDGEMAAIYNLGTIPEQRGKGIATSTLRETVEKLQEKNLSQIFLQTEKGSKNEDFFSGRGFETRFKAECVVEDEE